MSQKNMVLDYMRTFGSITPLQAMEEFNCMRLAARIADLEADGINIRHDKIRRINVYGKRISFSRYSLEQ